MSLASKIQIRPSHSPLRTWFSRAIAGGAVVALITVQGCANSGMEAPTDDSGLTGGTGGTLPGTGGVAGAPATGGVMGTGGSAGHPATGGTAGSGTTGGSGGGGSTGTGGAAGAGTGGSVTGGTAAEE